MGSGDLVMAKCTDWEKHGISITLFALIGLYLGEVGEIRSSTEGSGQETRPMAYGGQGLDWEAEELPECNSIIFALLGTVQKSFHGRKSVRSTKVSVVFGLI